MWQENRMVQLLAGALGLLMISVVSGDAQVGGFTTPLHVYASQSMTDEQGQILKGSSLHPGDAVQLLWASNRVIYPPAADGTPDPRNPEVIGGATSVGHMMPSHKQNSGRFNYALLGSLRLPDGSKIFARVFNAAAPTSASFYADSYIFTVTGNKGFDVNITRTSKPLDSEDDDGDGLNNSWEKSYGSNQTVADTDADGMSDYDEHITGTDLLDAGSYLGLTAVSMTTPGQMTITWQSVPGQTYRVEAMEHTTDGAGAQITLLSAPLTAAATQMQYVIDTALNNSARIGVRKVD